MAVVETDNFRGTGRRKNSVASVWVRPGSGKITVNKRDFKEYFPRKTWQIRVGEPLAITNSADKIDVSANVRGGGLTGQAGSISHGLARALLKYDETLRKKLKSAGLLRRDSRMVESKKYGRKKARRGQQFSKR
ncbi:MAG: 30S ribosomal protein S9 [Candidatus Dadabacteria bacterium]|nr:30S ribosomal protein S9 [Candidatus Dadabacteria bacterium]MCY4042201.1 30S ribosomal protein S9 [Candidatus Dadabacteria bacterium]MCY4047562.1 30S ribosomal protein S9 [Candidatus Dadabacteria bacterium]